MAGPTWERALILDQTYPREVWQSNQLASQNFKRLQLSTISQTWTTRKRDPHCYIKLNKVHGKRKYQEIKKTQQSNGDKPLPIYSKAYKDLSNATEQIENYRIVNKAKKYFRMVVIPKRLHRYSRKTTHCITIVGTKQSLYSTRLTLLKKFNKGYF